MADQTPTSIVTRFAPSPTGRLHLGSAYAAFFAHDAARTAGGRALLRFEDTDRERCRREYEDAIKEELDWLGMTWDGAVIRQSERSAAYDVALANLAEKGVTYPCFCSRKEIAAEIARSVSAPHTPDGPLYPGICKDLPKAEIASRIEQGREFAVRLNVERGSQIVGAPLSFVETGTGPEGQLGEILATPEVMGDIVIARKDGVCAYHLACVVDDAAQGVTCVTRGDDIFHATHAHRLLQALLSLPAPEYRHHKIILSKNGRRLSKRDKDQSISELRAKGATPTMIREMVGMPKQI